jgi:hypothetical protein
MINFSTRKVGGLYFIKLGRLTFMVCLSKRYKSLHPAKGGVRWYATPL